MELDEAIKHAEETADRQEKSIDYLIEAGLPKTAEKYRVYVAEVRQLVEWLKELRELRGESNG